MRLLKLHLSSLSSDTDCSVDESFFKFYQKALL